RARCNLPAHRHGHIESCHLRNRGEICKGVVAEVGHHVWLERELRRSSKEKCRAIWHRFLHGLDADATTGPCLVLDDDGSTQVPLQTIGNHTRSSIGCAACRKWKHDLDGLILRDRELVWHSGKSQAAKDRAT